MDGVRGRGDGSRGRRRDGPPPGLPDGTVRTRRPDGDRRGLSRPQGARPADPAGRRGEGRGRGTGSQDRRGLLRLRGRRDVSARRRSRRRRRPRLRGRAGRGVRHAPRRGPDDQRGGETGRRRRDDAGRHRHRDAPRRGLPGGHLPSRGQDRPRPRAGETGDAVRGDRRGALRTGGLPARTGRVGPHRRGGRRGLPRVRQRGGTGRLPPAELRPHRPRTTRRRTRAGTRPRSGTRCSGTSAASSSTWTR